MTGRRDASLQWTGRLVLGPGWAMYSGMAGDNRSHRHPALQLALGDGEPVRAEVDDQHIEAAGLLMAPLVRHQLHPGPVRLLYVERESAVGRRLATCCEHGGFRKISAEECVLLRARLDASVSIDAMLVSIVETLASTSTPDLAPVETASVRRVQAVIGCLPQRDSSEWTLRALAAEAALSPSRFAHLFRDLTGMAVRPYLRWLRLACAVEAAARGVSLTDAAHVAGFADAAHFTRTMRHHFGVTPGSVLAATRAH